MRKPWPQEVNDWLAENVPGRTTREVTELINCQGFDKRYGMTFTENMVKGAKKQAELEPFRLQYISGVIKMLEGIEISYTEEGDENEQ